MQIEELTKGVIRSNPIFVLLLGLVLPWVRSLSEVLSARVRAISRTQHPAYRYVWIIITYELSLPVDYHYVWIIITYGLSLRMDYHYVWILITCGFSLRMDYHPAYHYV